MRIPAQPRRGPWVQGPMAVELQLVAHPTAERPRAGRQPAGPPAVEQVFFLNTFVSE